jgi:hypothetical protein
LAGPGARSISPEWRMKAAIGGRVAHIPAGLRHRQLEKVHDHDHAYRFVGRASMRMRQRFPMAAGMKGASGDWPGRRVLLQRVRNRLIDYLEVASSFDAQRAFQQQVPELHVALEVVHQWQDWVGENWEAELAEPVFSADERVAMARFGKIWKMETAQLPDPVPPLETAMALPQWQRLCSAAAALLAVFGRRGRLSEECEDG